MALTAAAGGEDEAARQRHHGADSSPIAEPAIDRGGEPGEQEERRQRHGRRGEVALERGCWARAAAASEPGRVVGLLGQRLDQVEGGDEEERAGEDGEDDAVVPGGDARPAAARARTRTRPIRAAASAGSSASRGARRRARRRAGAAARAPPRPLGGELAAQEDDRADVADRGREAELGGQRGAPARRLEQDAADPEQTEREQRQRRSRAGRRPGRPAPRAGAAASRARRASSPARW